MSLTGTRAGFVLRDISTSNQSNERPFSITCFRVSVRIPTSLIDGSAGPLWGIGKVPTANGQFAGTWLEFDFGNKSNDNRSGADASCLVAATHGLETPALNVCSSGMCSTINTDGTGENAYIKGTEALDGVGLNLPPGKVYLTVTVGE
ncbi:hypothetical protein QQZ08_010863 [Neonectria magnoliae]|uniref:Uncharacterized protein n=1 Tax=Neonectria magnoliae TaxID=2732573 RepID=A0ABR1HEA1_9HYPO